MTPICMKSYRSFNFKQNVIVKDRQLQKASSVAPKKLVAS